LDAESSRRAICGVQNGTLGFRRRGDKSGLAKSTHRDTFRGCVTLDGRYPLLSHTPALAEAAMAKWNRVPPRHRLSIPKIAGTPMWRLSVRQLSARRTVIARPRNSHEICRALVLIARRKRTDSKKFTTSESVAFAANIDAAGIRGFYG
jgi:hypothetical protein